MTPLEKDKIYVLSNRQHFKISFLKIQVKKIKLDTPIGRDKSKKVKKKYICVLSEYFSSECANILEFLMNLKSMEEFIYYI